MWKKSEHGDYPVGPGFVVPEGYTRELALQSVGPGWAFLINTLFDYNEHMDRDNETHMIISQVKEKWGKLRIYGSTYGKFTDDFFGFIAALEWISGIFCEDCESPTPGVLREGGWLRTLCDKHAEGRPPCQAKQEDRDANSPDP